MEPLECGEAIFPSLGEASPNGAPFGFASSAEKCNRCLCFLRFLLFLFESFRLEKGIGTPLCQGKIEAGLGT
jgi:hypothetical protein